MQNELNQVNNQDVLDLRQYVMMLARAKWGIFLITLTVTFIGSFLAVRSTPIYLASSKILADPTPPNAARDEQFISSALVFLFFETQYEIIQSRSIAEKVVDKLNLLELYKQETLENEDNNVNPVAYLKEILKKLLGPSDDKKETSETTLTDENIRTMLATSIQANTKVTGGKQSQVINISFESDDPELAKSIVNAISQAYIQFGLQTRLEEVRDTEVWLSEQSLELRENLTKAEERLKEFRLTQGIVDSDLQQRDANSRMQSLNTQLVNVQTRFGEAEEVLKQVDAIEPNSSAFYSLGPVLANRIAGELVKDLSRQQSTVNELEKRYKNKHPKMIAARTELSSLEDSLSNEISKIVEQIRRDYQNARQQVINIQELIANERESIQALQGSTSTLMTLEREVENSRRVYESFMAKLMETNVKGEFSGSNISIIDYATTPKYPIKPRVSFSVAISFMFGLFLSVIYAFLKSSLKNTVTSASMLEESVKINTLGITHALQKKSLKNQSVALNYMDDNKSIFAEAINNIRTGLIFSNIDSPPKTILITSSAASEGKSTLATNLAAAYSQLGKTLLIEVDLRKPSMAKNLNLSREFGLTTILADSRGLDDCIISQGDSQPFDVITSGNTPQNPIEILSSKKFEQLLEKLKDKFEYIVLDGPPTLPVSDSIIVGNLVDAVILAVKADKTKVAAVKETLSRLRKGKVNVIGAVLTMATPRKMSYYGDHYYGETYYGTSAEG